MENEPSWFDDELIAASNVTTQSLPAGALYIVATPIGNGADITLRALWVLSHMDAIACEDTRLTRPLLERYRVRAPLLAAHEHNEHEAAARIAKRLARGERIALVTDAGTPAISDPGARLVRTLRDSGVRVIPIPGASSLTAAISAAGLQAARVTFVGFPPGGTRERDRLLQDITTSSDAFVLFEAPHRIAATVQALAAALAPLRRVVVARELTKHFETITDCHAAKLPQLIATAEPRGEYVVLIDAPPSAEAASEIDAVTRRWLQALRSELPASRLAAVAAKATGLPRARLYDALLGKEG